MAKQNMAELLGRVGEKTKSKNDKGLKQETQFVQKVVKAPAPKKRSWKNKETAYDRINIEIEKEFVKKIKMTVAMEDNIKCESHLLNNILAEFFKQKKH